MCARAIESGIFFFFFFVFLSPHTLSHSLSTYSLPPCLCTVYVSRHLSSPPPPLLPRAFFVLIPCQWRHPNLWEGGGGEANMRFADGAKPPTQSRGCLVFSPRRLTGPFPITDPFFFCLLLLLLPRPTRLPSPRWGLFLGRLSSARVQSVWESALAGGVFSASQARTRRIMRATQ